MRNHHGIYIYIVETASRACGIVKKVSREERSRLWNDEVKEAMKKKLMYRRLLDIGTEEAKRKLN